jgi:hypothetical protein
MRGSARARVLTGQRKIRGLPDSVRTPLLLPSLSSKSDVSKYAGANEFIDEWLAEPALISAYDLRHGLVKAPKYPPVMFLDSGGYEALRDYKFLKTHDKPAPDAQVWSQKHYSDALQDFSHRGHVVAVSYDHPEEQLSLHAQLERANALFLPTDDRFVREFLIKPEPEKDTIDLKVIFEHIDQLASYPLIGLTDKELGATLLEKLQNVALLRCELKRAGHDTPIHIFGSLDPLTAPLYFMAGADVFDGLAWLRYGFSQGRAIYIQNYEATELALQHPARLVQAQMWMKNYNYMLDLQGAMRRFLLDAKFEWFEVNSERLRKVSVSLEQYVKG